MSHFNGDELDRALFALPLEEPPADLRASILAATVYRPPAIMTPVEIGWLTALAVMVGWLVWTIALGGEPLLAKAAQATLSFLSNVNALAWLAAGGATAIWLSLGLNGQAPVRERTVRR